MVGEKRGEERRCRGGEEGGELGVGEGMERRERKGREERSRRRGGIRKEKGGQENWGESE